MAHVLYTIKMNVLRKTRTHSDRGNIVTINNMNKNSKLTPQQVTDDGMTASRRSAR